MVRSSPEKLRTPMPIRDGHGSLHLSLRDVFGTALRALGFLLLTLYLIGLAA
jgi:hypothetical protein